MFQTLNFYNIISIVTQVKNYHWLISFLDERIYSFHQKYFDVNMHLLMALM